LVNPDLDAQADLRHGGGSPDKEKKKESNERHVPIKNDPGCDETSGPYKRPRKDLQELIEKILLAFRTGKYRQHALSRQGQKSDLGQELDNADEREQPVSVPLL
jgi:hypothetical protein